MSKCPSVLREREEMSAFKGDNCAGLSQAGFRSAREKAKEDKQCQ